jgi:hypothetical protein
MATNGQYPLVVYSYKIRFDNQRQNLSASRWSDLVSPTLWW